jgi:methionyl-tRNA formyltransferase
MKPRIIFLGGKNLGFRVLEWITNDDRFEISGICLSPNSDISEEVKFKKLIEQRSLREIALSDLNDMKFDLGVSVNYHKIIHDDILSLAPKGFWNIHHSYNMRLRGRNITTHAILRSKKENVYYHGTSIHKMIAQLDAGPVVATLSTAILPSDTAYSLFSKVDKLALKLFIEWFPRIAFEQIYTYSPPNNGVLIFKNNDLPSREISYLLSSEEIYDIVRAFDFPGKESAYIISNGRKIELVIKRRGRYKTKVEISNRIYFTPPI